MRIGIDIDNTIVDTRKSVFKYKRKSKFKHNKGYYLEWSKKEQEEFLKEYVEEIQKHAEVKEYAKEAIDLLKEMGHDIVIITYRDNLLSNKTKKNTMQYLKEHTIYYDEIVFGAFNKGKVCKEKHIDLLIDDSLENIKSAVQVGISVLVYPMFYNKNTKYPRVKNWKEVLQHVKKLESTR